MIPSGRFWLTVLLKTAFLLEIQNERSTGKNVHCSLICPWHTSSTYSTFNISEEENIQGLHSTELTHRQSQGDTHHCTPAHTQFSQCTAKLAPAALGYFSQHCACEQGLNLCVGKGTMVCTGLLNGHIALGMCLVMSFVSQAESSIGLQT